MEALPPSAARIDGPATLTIVASMRSMMLAAITTANTNQRSGLRAAGGASALSAIAQPPRLGQRSYVCIRSHLGLLTEYTVRSC